MAQPQPHRVGRNGHGGGPATCSITGKWFGCAVLFSTLEPGAFRYRFGVTWRNLPPNPPPGEDQRSFPTRPGDSRPVWPGDFVFAASAWRTAGHPAKECGHRRLAACISPPQHKITPKRVVFALFAPWRYLCIIRVVPTDCVRLVGLPSGTSSAERTDVLTGMRSRMAAWRLINTLHLTFHFT